jgi:hypothetical protein
VPDVGRVVPGSILSAGRSPAILNSGLPAERDPAGRFVPQPGRSAIAAFCAVTPDGVRPHPMARDNTCGLNEAPAARGAGHQRRVHRRSGASQSRAAGPRLLFLD